MTKTPHLIVTWALDRIGQHDEAVSAKLLVSSLLRCFSNSQIIVFRRCERPLYLVERLGVIEIDVEEDDNVSDLIKAYRGPAAPLPWELSIESFVDLASYDKVLFISPHALALRNIDHLLEGDWEISASFHQAANELDELGRFISLPTQMRLATTELASPSFVAIKASKLTRVLKGWRYIHDDLMEGYQKSPHFQISEDTDEDLPWNSEHTFAESLNLLLKEISELDIHKVEKGEIKFPFWFEQFYSEYKDGALLMPDCGPHGQRQKLFYSLFMGVFFNDPKGDFFNFLEI